MRVNEWASSPQVGGVHAACWLGEDVNPGKNSEVSVLLFCHAVLMVQPLQEDDQRMSAAGLQALHPRMPPHSGWWGAAGLQAACWTQLQAACPVEAPVKWSMGAADMLASQWKGHQQKDEMEAALLAGHTLPPPALAACTAKGGHMLWLP